MYLVRDINLPICFTNLRISFNEIWCYDYFNDAVKCILRPSQDLEKVRGFQSREKKVNEYFDKKNRGLVNW